jgi:uncharacterized protein YegL
MDPLWEPCFKLTEEVAMRNSLPIRLAATALLLGLQSCSSGNAETTIPLDQDSGTDSGSSLDSTSDTMISTDVGDDSGDDPLGGGCAMSSSVVQLRPLDLCLMLDQSGSMLGQKWDSVTAALNAFVTAQSSATDLQMSVQFFPLSGAGVCDLNAYAVPDIPMGEMSTVGPLLADSLKKRTPDGQTPTLPALQGAISYAQDWGTAHSDHTVAVILATDGEPDICGSTVDKVAQAATLGDQAQVPIKTFVIGVGKSLTSLDDIAKAGGSTHAFLVDDSSQSTQQEFLDALNEIRGTAIPCDLDIPKPEAGQLDYTLVNVVRTASGKKIVLPEVSGAAQCGNSPTGWYYDDPQKPTKIILCSSVCQDIRADSKGRIDVVFGCKTIVA